MKNDFLTAAGRMVQGDPFYPQTTDQQGNLLTYKSGPKMGQPKSQWFIAVAFPKMVNGQPNAEFGALFGQMQGIAQASFPALGQIAGPWDPNCRFAWKVMDGDGVDDNGKPNASKPGFAGHWVVKFASGFAPKCFHAGHYQPHEQIQPNPQGQPQPIRRGYFVRVSGTIEGNANVQKPGLYVNLQMVELAGLGEEIISGPDATAVFGAQAAALPVGATALPAYAPGGVPQPMAPVGAPVPLQQFAPPSPLGVPTLPQGMGGMPMQPSPLGVPSGAPGMPQPPVQPMQVQPHPGFLAGPAGLPGMPVPGGLQPLGAPVGLAPLAPPQPQLTPAAIQAGHTYDKLRAMATDDQLRAGGYIV